MRIKNKGKNNKNFYLDYNEIYSRKDENVKVFLLAINKKGNEFDHLDGLSALVVLINFIVLFRLECWYLFLALNKNMS